MAKPMRKFDRAPRSKQSDLDMFWKEYESIEPNIQENAEEEDEHLSELEQDVEWLKEAGFDSVVARYRDSKEINADDLDFKNMTSSLTRKQAEAVRRRVTKLNANVKERLSLQETSSGPVLKFSVPENTSSRQRSHHTDIRSIFPTQTVGEPSNNNRMPPYPSRRSYSEGVPLVRSEVITYPQLRNSHSQENINRISAGGPVKVLTTGANIQTQLISRPAVSPQARSRTPSPKTKRQSASYAVQLTGKGTGSHGDGSKTVQGQSPVTVLGEGGGGAGGLSKKLGGSLFYITAVNNPASDSPSAAAKMKDLSINDNWELSSRKNSPSLADNSVTTPEQEFQPSSHNEINEENFKEIPVTDEKPIIESQKSANDYETPPKFPVLPNFTLTRDGCGITRIEDLSARDMEKVRSLALIELTSLFEVNKLVFNRRKPTKRKTKEHGIFGVPLLTLIQRDRGDNPKFNTPVILEEMIAFLENSGIKEEGILRVPGSAARVRVTT